MSFDFLTMLLFILFSILTRFQLTHQFVMRLEGTKIRPENINFYLHKLLVSKNDDQEAYEVSEIEEEGLTNWQQFFSNVHIWKTKNEQMLWDYLIKRRPRFINIFNFMNRPSSDLRILRLLVTSPSKESFFKSFAKEFPNILLQADQTILDVIVFTLKGSKMNSEDLQATIDFFLQYNFYRQLVCLMTYQKNPPILFVHFKNASIDKMTKLFEYLIMMNSDKIDIFFIPIISGGVSSDLSTSITIAALIASNKRLPTKFNEIIGKVFDSKFITKSELIESICLGLMASNYNVHNRINLFLRNEQLIDYFYSKVNNDKTIGKKEIPDVLLALKACRVINLIKLDPFDYETIIYAIRFNEDGTYENSVGLLFFFKLLRQISSKLNHNYFEDHIESFEVKLSFIVF